MNGGDNSDKREIMAPPYLRIGKHRIPLDVLSFILGLFLILLNEQIASYTQFKPTDITTIGEVLLALGAVFFIFGRIER